MSQTCLTATKSGMRTKQKPQDLLANVTQLLLSTTRHVEPRGDSSFVSIWNQLNVQMLEINKEPEQRERKSNMFDTSASSSRIGRLSETIHIYLQPLTQSNYVEITISVFKGINPGADGNEKDEESKEEFFSLSMPKCSMIIPFQNIEDKCAMMHVSILQT